MNRAFKLASRTHSRVRFPRALRSKPTNIQRSLPIALTRRFSLSIQLATGKTITWIVEPSTTTLRHLAAYISIHEGVPEEFRLLKVEAKDPGKRIARKKAGYKTVMGKYADWSLMKHRISPDTRIVIDIDLSKAVDEMLSL